jgi:hypothetical protein
MIDGLGPLLREMLTDPRAAAHRLDRQGIGLRVAFEAALVVSALAAILQYLLFLTLPPPDAAGGPVAAAGAGAMPDPLVSFLMQLGQVVASAAGASWVARALGGTGDFRRTLAVLVLVGAVGLGWMAVVLVTLSLLPGLGLLALAGALSWSLWAFAAAVAAVHGFSSTLKVLGVTLVCVVVLSVVIAVVMALVAGPEALAPETGA